MVPPQFHHKANFVSPHFQYQTQSQNPQPFPNPNPNQLSAPNSDFRINQLDDDEPTEKIVSTSRYSKFDLCQYPDFDLGQYSDFDDVSEEETDPACNDFDIGQYPNFDDETAAAEEDVVDDNEEEVMTIPEEELVKIAVDCCTKIIRIKKDDCFYTKEDWKIALYTKCVEDGYQLKVNKSSKDRFETRVYRGHEIMTDMNARFKISISYSQAWRAKCYALELLRGSPEASFAQLPAYCHNLKLKNPGSVTHIKTDRDGCFELLFIAIGAAIHSFITCMRPVIIVDGAHLKGRYLGVKLLAVAMDANNGILPIAYGVGKSETSDSWTWFMGHLRDCIGPISNLTIISDRANSIDNVVRRCFSDAFHGLCGVHLYRNLKSRSAGTLEHCVTPWTEKKITKRVVKSTSWRVEPCSNTLFEVLDNNLNGLVDLNAKTCSCMKWQTSGYPCGHVIKVALHLNQDDSSAYAMDCYTTEVYRQTYVEIIYPIPHPSEWDIPDDLQTVLPPAMDRRLPVRPKSHDRIPSKGEEKKRSTCSRSLNLISLKSQNQLIMSLQRQNHSSSFPSCFRPASYTFKESPPPPQTAGKTNLTTSFYHTNLGFSPSPGLVPSLVALSSSTSTLPLISLTLRLSLSLHYLPPTPSVFIFLSNPSFFGRNMGTKSLAPPPPPTSMSSGTFPGPNLDPVQNPNLDSISLSFFIGI
ncbi:hypothetical protein F3Y22_tig00110949pilonHSYRG00042 [Hibiscus syriacus]|uniref:SWIM-type domain-containing protein n=1 Tax=Hibiscus syriacus TaxID=106335 RepID=A0A6A2ZAY7_HIBSY|nr:hypothetical protein F3Y22_tig00110949pilonHSYRG00042 [Hibiscus syriacus]